MPIGKSGQAADKGASFGHLFLSYSRQDKAFVRSLAAGLAEHGRDTWIDLNNIRPSEKWMPSIEAAIDEADAVLFVISPDSIRSEVCSEELDYALAQQKRLVPVVAREPGADVRKQLAELNWIFARETDSQAEAIDKIIEAVETDLDWVRAHTRLLVHSVEWEQRRRDASFTLRGTDLREFEDWQASAAGKEPRLTQLQTEFLLASRRATTRRQQLTWAGVTAAVVIVSVVGTLAWLQSQERARQEEIAGARRLLSESEVMRAAPEDQQGRRQQALAAATNAMDTLAKLNADTTNADRALRQSYLRLDKWRDPLGGAEDWSVDNVTFSSDGRQVAFYTARREMVLVDIDSGAVLAECQRNLFDQTESRGSYGRWLALSPDGRYLALRISGGTNKTGPWNRLTIWQLQPCEELGSRLLEDNDPSEVEGLAFTADNRSVLFWGRGIVRAWDFREGDVRNIPAPQGTRAFVPGPDSVTGIAYTADRKTRTRRLTKFNLATGELLGGWPLEDAPLQLTWSAGGIAVGDIEGYSLLSSTGELRGTYAALTRLGAKISGDGRRVAVMPDERTIEIYAPATGERVARTRRNSKILGFTFVAGTEALVAVSNYQFDVGVWHYGDSGAYAKLPVAAGADDIAFSDDGRTLYAHSEGRQLSWHLPGPAAFTFPAPTSTSATGPAPRPPMEFNAPNTSANALAESVLKQAKGGSNREAVLRCGDSTRGGCERVLEILESGALRASLNLEPVLVQAQAAFLQFSGNSDYLIVGMRRDLSILDWQTLSPVGSLLGDNAVLVAVAPRLSRGATLDRGGVTRVWDLTHGTQTAQIEIGGGTSALELSADGRWLAALTEAGTSVHLFALEPRDLVNQACRWLDDPCPGPSD